MLRRWSRTPFWRSNCPRRLWQNRLIWPRDYFNKSCGDRPSPRTSLQRKSRGSCGLHSIAAGRTDLCHRRMPNLPAMSWGECEGSGLFVAAEPAAVPQWQHLWLSSLWCWRPASSPRQANRPGDWGRLHPQGHSRNPEPPFGSSQSPHPRRRDLARGQAGRFHTAARPASWRAQ